jgi:hypothetical protein
LKQIEEAGIRPVAISVDAPEVSRDGSVAKNFLLPNILRQTHSLQHN